MTRMYQYYEKLTLGYATIISAACSGLGAILTTGEFRWFCVTGFLSSILSGFLALMFKRPEHTTKLTVSRCAIAVFGGVFGAYPAVHYFGVDPSNIIALGGVTCLVCAGFFTLGFAGLSYIEKRSSYISRKFIDSKLGGLLNEKPAAEE